MIVVAILAGGLCGWVLNLLAKFLVQVAGYGDRRPRFTGKEAIWLQGVSAFLLAGGIGWIMAMLAWPAALIPSLVLVFLLLLAVIDVQYRLVLNLLIYPALLLALVANLAIGQQSWLVILLGGLFAFGVFYATALVRPNDLGGGDVKLATLIGVGFGFPYVLYALLSAAFLGGIVALWLRFVQNRSWKSTIPYAPFLCFGAAFVLLVVMM
ncbi:MAG: prepilin peptidase [Anaerolineae bacterium]|nr:prepilin peptidase [Anaerolineae bacterium]